jgi:hypothetical protein
MGGGSDISALYREFTDALTEVLAESSVGPAPAFGRALLSKSIPTTPSMTIFFQSSIHAVGSNSECHSIAPM